MTIVKDDTEFPPPLFFNLQVSHDSWKPGILVKFSTVTEIANFKAEHSKEIHFYYSTTIY